MRRVQEWRGNIYEAMDRSGEEFANEYDMG